VERHTTAPSSLSSESVSVARSIPGKAEQGKRAFADVAAQGDLSKHLERHNWLSRASLRSRDETL